MAKQVVPRCTMWVSASGSPEWRMRVNTLPRPDVTSSPETPPAAPPVVTYADRQPFQSRSSTWRSGLQRFGGGALDLVGEALHELGDGDAAIGLVAAPHVDADR